MWLPITCLTHCTDINLELVIKCEICMPILFFIASLRRYVMATCSDVFYSIILTRLEVKVLDNADREVHNSNTSGDENKIGKTEIT